MDAIELSYDSMDAVPEPVRPLYVEQNGKAVLAKVNGLKTQQDVLNVQEALRKERADHAAAREALKTFSSLGKDPKDLQELLDRLPELEERAKGGIDESKIQTLLEQRLGQKTAPLERQLNDLNTTLQTVTAERDQFRQLIERRDMSEAVRAVATEMKVLASAIPDVELFAQMALERQEDGSYIVRDGINGVTSGVDLKTMLKDLQKVRPHWWPASEGGGAGGSGGFGGAGGDNPWSAKNWNITKQGQYVKEHGMEAAQRAAKAAGVAVGATKPAQK